MGHEPRDLHAARGATRGRGIERPGRRIPRLPQGDREEPLPHRTHPFRRFHAGRGGRGVDHRGALRRGRRGRRIRCRGHHPRRRLGERPELLQRLPPLLLRRPVSAARHHGHRPRQGYERRRHGGAHGAQDPDGRRRMARRTDGPSRRTPRRSGAAAPRRHGGHPAHLRTDPRTAPGRPGTALGRCRRTPRRAPRPPGRPAAGGRAGVPRATGRTPRHGGRAGRKPLAAAHPAPRLRPGTLRRQDRAVGRRGRPGRPPRHRAGRRHDPRRSEAAAHAPRTERHRPCRYTNRLKKTTNYG